MNTERLGWIGTPACIMPHPCTQNDTCRNGGRCVRAGERHLCECALGYRGAHCETLYDLCAEEGAQLCGAHGTCYRTPRSRVREPQCACELFWTGPRCDVPDPSIRRCDGDGGAEAGAEAEVGAAAVNPCLNGGTCFIENHSASLAQHCRCRPPFVGLRCQFNETLLDLLSARTSPDPDDADANATLSDWGFTLADNYSDDEQVISSAFARTRALQVPIYCYVPSSLLCAFS